MEIKDIFSKKEIDEENFMEEIDIHKRNKRIRFALIIFIVVAIAISIFIYQKTRVYKTVKVVSDIKIENGASGKYITYGEMFAKYSEDGVSYYNKKQQIWNQAFEMKEPIIDSCGEYVVVADQGGTNIFLFNKKGLVKQIETSFPIVKVEVAKQGVVAAVLEDSNTNYIEITDKEGEKLVTSKTELESNGYPLDFSISEDGKKMVVSYLFVSGGVMQSKVLFYNFSEVGQNEVDRMVGGFNQYSKSVVPRVEFLSNDIAVAFGDDILTFYTVKQKPTILYETKLAEEVEQICYSGEYAGLVLKNTDSQYQEKHKVVVYNLKGKKVMEQYIDDISSNVKLVDDCILTYDENGMRIYSRDGKVKLDYGFTEEVIDVLPVSLRVYYIVKDDKVELVRLK